MGCLDRVGVGQREERGIQDTEASARVLWKKKKEQGGYQISVTHGVEK